MIYPLKPGGNYWVMPASGHDARGPDEGGGKLTHVGDAFSWSDNREVRNEVSSVAKSSIPKAFNENHSACRKRGYMFKSSDWILEHHIHCTGQGVDVYFLYEVARY
jgi:hypothetical protein